MTAETERLVKIPVFKPMATRPDSAAGFVPGTPILVDVAEHGMAP